MIQQRVFKSSVSGSVMSLTVNYAKKLWSEFRFDEKSLVGNPLRILKIYLDLILRLFFMEKNELKVRLFLQFFSDKHELVRS